MLGLMALSATTIRALIAVGSAAAGAAGGALVNRYGGRVLRGIGKALTYIGRKISGEVKFPGYEHVKESPPPAVPAETPTKSPSEEEPAAEPIPAIPAHLPVPDSIRRGPDRLLDEVEFSPAGRGPERAVPAQGSGKDVSPSHAPSRLSLREFMRRSLGVAELAPPPARQEEE